MLAAYIFQLIYSMFNKDDKLRTEHKEM